MQWSSQERCRQQKTLTLGLSFYWASHRASQPKTWEQVLQGENFLQPTPSICSPFAASLQWQVTLYSSFNPTASPKPCSSWQPTPPNISLLALSPGTHHPQVHGWCITAAVPWALLWRLLRRPTSLCSEPRCHFIGSETQLNKVAVTRGQSRPQELSGKAVGKKGTKSDIPDHKRSSDTQLDFLPMLHHRHVNLFKGLVIFLKWGANSNSPHLWLPFCRP